MTVFDVRVCRVCGCTDEDCSGCIERTGRRCWWLEADFCSACAGPPVGDVDGGLVERQPGDDGNLPCGWPGTTR